MTERVISKNEREYKNLEFVAKALEISSPNNAQYIVEDVYLDFGQRWMWTTIVRRGFRECQVLSPREWEEIMLADGVRELAEIAEEIRNGDYFGDR